MKNYIRYLDYNFDKELLLKQAADAKVHAMPYTDVRYPELKFPDWHIGRHNSEYIEKIMHDFGINGSPRFYWMKPFAVVPRHTDNGTKCSLNFILTDNAAPIKIGSLNAGQHYSYKAALLNTTIPHSVTNNHEERIMLKISIFDEFFETVDERIPYKRDMWWNAKKS